MTSRERTVAVLDGRAPDHVPLIEDYNIPRADNLPVAEAQASWETVRRQAGTCDVAEADGLDS